MPTKNKQKLKPYIYTHKNKMKNIGAAFNLKLKESRKLRKTTYPKSAAVGKQNETNKSLISIKQLAVYTRENDSKFKQYATSKKFKELAKKNPTIFIVNAIFITIFKYSFIARLLEKENEELAACIEHFILLNTDKSKSSILEQITKHGFNTIYDILLENPESIYLFSFCAHATSLGLIADTNKFIKNLSKNKLHKDMRNRKVVEQLQVSNLYTRVKRFQLS
jgi:hypothetical protein